MSAPELRPLGASHEGNILRRLTRVAKSAPSRVALWFPRDRGSRASPAHRALTYGQLEEESDRYARGLADMGIERGTRVLLMVPAGAEFLAVTFALFKVGAVVILIDPGMGKNNLLQCIREVAPEGLIAVSLIQALRRLYRRNFAHLKFTITVGRRWFWGGPTLAQLRGAPDRFAAADPGPDDPAAIIFTTGSTGVPKGVLYRHGMLEAQVRAIEEAFQIREGEVGLAAFAPFALFSIAMGTSCVLPIMDPTKPAKVDPAGVLGSIRDYRVTYSFGSPAFWDRVSQYGAEHGVEIPAIEKIMMAGAPVSERILSRLATLLPAGAETYTPYGATEALPLTSMTGTEILHDTVERTRSGAGICVGRPLPGVTLKIIRIDDEEIPEWNDALALPAGEIGEIVAHGPVVSREYIGREKETARAKIRQGNIVWHRMGDVGYLDERQRLWFCGRKNHRVVTRHGTLFPVQCEAIFNRHPSVFRSALVGVDARPAQRPVLVVEPEPGKMPKRPADRARLIGELLELGRQSPRTREISDILFHPALPVDFRHNAKILRERIAVWAEKKIRPSGGSLRPAVRQAHRPEENRGEAQGSKATWRKKSSQ
jgi:olefin beta-lactone synthetase